MWLDERADFEVVLLMGTRSRRGAGLEGSVGVGLGFRGRC